MRWDSNPRKKTHWLTSPSLSFDRVTIRPLWHATTQSYKIFCNCASAGQKSHPKVAILLVAGADLRHSHDTGFIQCSISTLSWSPIVVHQPAHSPFREFYHGFHCYGCIDLPISAAARTMARRVAAFSSSNLVDSANHRPFTVATAQSRGRQSSGGALVV